MLMSLAAPCAGDKEICLSLIQFFHDREIHNREPLHAAESAVLTALFSQIHQEAYNGGLVIKNLTTKVNEILKKNGERLHLSPRKVGAVLATLGFAKRRINIGWLIVLERADQVRVHKLVNTHGIDINIEPFLKADLRDCPLCKGDSPRPELQSDPR
jgi:hypothetical protein